MALKTKLKRFNDSVLGNFQMYNSVFTGLPFDSISSTGVMLPLFHETCEKGFKNKKNPTEIVDYFFQKYQDNPTEEE